MISSIDRIMIHIVNTETKSKILRKYFYHIGKDSKICNYSFGLEPYLIWVGDNVIVASGVKFINHDASYYTVCRIKEIKGSVETEKRGGIILRDNCFIGCNAILLPGADVGKNSVIAAGSVVNKKIPANEVWGGVPAKYISQVEEYAIKVIESVQKLPWYKNKFELTEKELIRQIQMYYVDQYL